MQFRRFVKAALAATVLCLGAAQTQVNVMLPANPGGDGATS